MLQGRILLALEALQHREPAGKLRAGRPGALRFRHPGEQPGVPPHDAGELALERRGSLIDERVGERVRDLRGAVRRGVLDRDGDDVTRVDDVGVERVEQRVARAPDAEQRAHRVGDERAADERGSARRRGALPAGVAQHVDAVNVVSDAETGETRSCAVAR